MLRKNGLQPSCEPCRKSKLACDHSVGICQRCRQRGISDRCFYHPAPLSKRRRYDSPQHGTSSVVGSKAHHKRVVVQRRESSQQISDQDDISDVSCHSAVEIASATAPANLLLPSALSIVGADGNHVAEPNGSSLLGLLHPFSGHAHLIEQYLASGAISAIPGPIVLRCLPALEAFSKLCARSKEPQWTADVLERLLRASQRSEPVLSAMTASEFQDCLTGDNIGWEVVGIVFALSGSSALLFSAQPNLREYALGMLRASNSCVAMCFQYNKPTLLTVWLLCENLTLVVLAYGEASHAAWDRLSDLAACITALGLHLEPDEGGTYGPLMLEIRRRLFAIAFHYDKCICTFLGRPPRIAALYATVLPPSTVSEDGYCSALGSDKAIGSIDVWSEPSECCPAALVRLHYMTSLYREEILDSALAHSDTMSCESLLNRADRSWAALPQMYRYNPDVWEGTLKPEWAYRLLIVQMDHLYNAFQAERLQSTVQGADRSGVLMRSSELLDAVLELIRCLEDGRLDHRTPIFEILFYGLPCTSALVDALSLATLLHEHTTSTKGRGDLIRDISVFLSCLEWIVPDGHRAQGLCARARTKLSQKLDELLDEAWPSTVSTSRHASMHDTVILPETGHLDGNLSFVDTIDWNEAIFEPSVAAM